MGLERFAPQSHPTSLSRRWGSLFPHARRRGTERVDNESAAGVGDDKGVMEVYQLLTGPLGRHTIDSGDGRGSICSANCLPDIWHRGCRGKCRAPPLNRQLVVS